MLQAVFVVLVSACLLVSSSSLIAKLPEGTLNDAIEPVFDIEGKCPKLAEEFMTRLKADLESIRSFFSEIPRVQHGFETVLAAFNLHYLKDEKLKHVYVTVLPPMSFSYKCDPSSFLVCVEEKYRYNLTHLFFYYSGGDLVMTVMEDGAEMHCQAFRILSKQDAFKFAARRLIAAKKVPSIMDFVRAYFDDVRFEWLVTRAIHGHDTQNALVSAVGTEEQVDSEGRKWITRPLLFTPRTQTTRTLKITPVLDTFNMRVEVFVNGAGVFRAFV